jgi:putative addiction module component (TIGR02574 family)
MDRIEPKDEELDEGIKRELSHRVAEIRQHPEVGILWEVVKAEAKARWVE